MVEISVIILVKNGGAFLGEVLEGLFSQKGVAAFEVVAVDSGSTDNSREILNRYPVRVEEIPPATFNHGETRNLGARLSQGMYLVYLTQDALPGDDKWLAKLVEPLREDPLVAGTFSSHRPRKDCPLMERRQILQTRADIGKREEGQYGCRESGVCPEPLSLYLVLEHQFLHPKGGLGEGALPESRVCRRPGLGQEGP